MGIQVVWDNDGKTIMRYIYDSSWTWDQLADAIKQAEALYGDSDHKVGVIIDLTNSSMLPKDALSRGRTMADAPHFEKLTIVVGANAFVRSFKNLFDKLYSAKIASREVHFAADLPEARQIITERLAQA